MSQAQLIGAIKDAQRVLAFAVGTKFHECVKNSIGRQLANLFHEDKFIADVPWDVCDILRGAKSTDRKLRFYGIQQHVSLYRDAKDSFEFKPFSEINADLRQGKLVWAYHAILLRSENMDQKQVKSVVDNILDDFMDLGDTIRVKSHIGYKLPNQRDLVQAYDLLKHRHVSVL